MAQGWPKLSISAVAALVLGACLGLMGAILVWDHLLAPACDPTDAGGGGLQTLVCVSGGPPLWLLGCGIALGAVAGVVALRTLMRRRLENTTPRASSRS